MSDTQLTTTPDYSDTTRYKRLSNGAILSIETGKICANPGGGNTAINSANARQMQSLRTQRAQEAVEAAIIAGTKAENIFGGMETLAKAQVKIALDKRQGRASTEAYKTLVKHAGLISDDEKHSGRTTINVLDPSIAERLIAALTADTVDATATEVTDAE